MARRVAGYEPLQRPFSMTDRQVGRRAALPENRAPRMSARLARLWGSTGSGPGPWLPICFAYVDVGVVTACSQAVERHWHERLKS